MRKAANMKNRQIKEKKAEGRNSVGQERKFFLGSL